MRVLDVGSGRGDVALLVGAQGDVVGIDRDAGALDLARGRVREMGLTNVTFVACSCTRPTRLLRCAPWSAC